MQVCNNVLLFVDANGIKIPYEAYAYQFGAAVNIRRRINSGVTVKSVLVKVR